MAELGEYVSAEVYVTEYGYGQQQNMLAAKTAQNTVLPLHRKSFANSPVVEPAGLLQLLAETAPVLAAEPHIVVAVPVAYVGVRTKFVRKPRIRHDVHAMQTYWL